MACFRLISPVLSQSASFFLFPRRVDWNCPPRVGNDRYLYIAAERHVVVSRRYPNWRRCYDDASFVSAFAATASTTFASGDWPGGAADAPGVTDTEIKIGQTIPYSGPLSLVACSAAPRLPISK